MESQKIKLEKLQFSIIFIAVFGLITDYMESIFQNKQWYLIDINS